jgi:hypothetical protein
MQSTIRKDIEKCGVGIPTHITILGGMEGWEDLPLPYSGTWEKCPDEILDRKFEAGFGRQDVPDYQAWSSDWIWYLLEFDGSTHAKVISRNYTKDI